MAEQIVFSPGTEGTELVPGVSTVQGSITDALVLKNGNLFFLSQSMRVFPSPAATGSVSIIKIAGS
jgi:hypothetical protein